MNTDSLIDVIPGAKTIENALKALSDVVDHLPDFIELIDPEAVKRPFRSIVKQQEHALKAIEHGWNWNWTHLSSYTGVTLTQELLIEALGVNITPENKDAWTGVQTVDKFIGFMAALTYGSMGIDALAKMFLANRVPEHITEPLKKLPEELGLSWAIGTFIETILEAAVGRSIEEAIGEQKRPNRLGWPELRTLFKQHVLSEDKADEWLRKLGYPDDQIKLIKELVTNQVPIGDLQQMFLYDLRGRHEIHKDILAMGFSDSDADDLVAMYIDKIQTSSGAMYRSTARSLVTRDLISMGQYKGVLEHTHTPKRELADDVAAIELEKEHGRLSTSISTLKALYVRGKIGREHVNKELAMLGYSEGAIKDILTAWDLPASVRPHGLSQAKVLSYYISGIIKTEDARALLLGANVRADTVEFLLTHPSASAGVHMRALSPGVVIEAYITGALTVDDLPDAFKRAHVPADQIAYFLSIAKYRKLHTKKAGDGTVPLGKGDIIAAFKYAILDQSAAQNELEHLGYSSENATILLEIENKGIFQPPTPSPFKDVGAAIAFMQANGYTVVPPPNPMLIAAEQVLAGAGYSWYQTPPPLPITQGGGPLVGP